MAEQTLSPLPADPVLAKVARYLDEYEWAAWLMDPQLKLLWVSSEFRELVGPTLERYIGKHYIAATLSDEVTGIATRRSLMRAGLAHMPLYLRFTEGGREGLRALLTEILGPDAATIVDHYEDEDPGPVIGSSMRVHTVEGMEPVQANAIVIQLRDDQGELRGHLSMFVGTLPFRFVPLLARGDEATLERTARLAKPGQRQAAILFADLESSGVLSSRLPSATYFALVQEIISALDEVVTSHTGIVGRHAGDGVTAFFIVEDAGSPSLAARAAVDAGRAIAREIETIAARYETETDGLITPKDLLVNVGLHWGNALYMGQLVSKGRLEVTALGDAVNECARIQESASEGRILASKQLLENLTDDDAVSAGLRPTTIAYLRLAELPGATRKAVRDAGGIAVTEL